jgi:hypothetical protein
MGIMGNKKTIRQLTNGFFRQILYYVAYLIIVRFEPCSCHTAKDMFHSRSV